MAYKNLKNIMLSERSQSQKTIMNDSSYAGIIPNRQTYRGRKVVRDGHGLGGGCQQE